jgi:hypothetical protein
MSLFDEPEDEKKEPEVQEDSNGKALLAFLAILLPVYFLVRSLAGPDMAYTASLCLFVNMVVVGICWDLRMHTWFWGIMLVVVALHVPLVFMVQWPHYWVPGIALLPIGLVDVFIVVRVVRFTEKFIVKSPPPDDEE